MKLWSKWPEGCEMDAMVNVASPIGGCWRVGLWLPFISILLRIPYQRDYVRIRSLVRIAPRRRRSPFLFWRQLYYDYARDSLVVHGQHIPFERLDDLALQLNKERETVCK